MTSLEKSKNRRNIRQGCNTLRPATIEKVFTDCVMDLKEVVVLDGIDILPDQSGFRVRSHDLHGQLPEIVMQNSGDTFLDVDRLGREACKLIAIMKPRDQITWLLQTLSG